MNLHTLRPEGRRLLTRAFLDGERQRWQLSECEDLVSALDRNIPLDEFVAVIDTFSRRPRQRAEVDGPLAVELHKSLRLFRREAADPGVWRYLAIFVAPEFIRHRWKQDQAPFHRRFWQPGTRPDSNYYSRLWWIAELTAGTDRDYDRTLKVLRSQALATAIFVRSICHYFPAVKACVDVLADEPGDVIARVVREFYRELALVPREALADGDIIEMLRHELARL